MNLLVPRFLNTTLHYVTLHYNTLLVLYVLGGMACCAGYIQKQVNKVCFVGQNYYIYSELDN